MLLCPHCGASKSGINRTKTDTPLDGIVRYRTCKSCGRSFQTIERWPQVAEEVADAPPKPATTRYTASFEVCRQDPTLAAIPDYALTDLCYWWNVDRMARHGKAAAWTEYAFLGSARRLATMYYQGRDSQADKLLEMGREHGWMALKSEYLPRELPATISPSQGNTMATLQPKGSEFRQAISMEAPDG